MSGVEAMRGSCETATTTEPVDDRPARAGAGDDAGRQVGHDEEGQRERHGADAGGERAVVEQDLEVLGDEEDRAEQAEVDGGDGGAGAGEARVAEHVHVQQRRGRAQLVDDEQTEDRGAARQRGQRDAVDPAVAPAADDAVDERAQADHRQHRPERVEPPVLGIARLGHDQPQPHQGERDDRQVHQEDRAPVEVLEQQPAGERPEGDADARRARPHRDGPLPLGRVGERVRDDRQRRREDQRGADAGEPAHGDEPAGRRHDGRGQAPERRRSRGRRRAPAADRTGRPGCRT